MINLPVKDINTLLIQVISKDSTVLRIKDLYNITKSLLVGQIYSNKENEIINYIYVLSFTNLKLLVFDNIEQSSIIGINTTSLKNKVKGLLNDTLLLDNGINKGLKVNIYNHQLSFEGSEWLDYY